MATEFQPLPLSSSPGAFWSPEVDEELVCIDVRRETHDVRTFTFRAREPRSFQVVAGQYFRFEVTIDGEPLVRCYSVSSSALRPAAVSITVKRVPGGRVSNWLHDHLQPGMTMRASGPAGRFTLPEPVAGPLLLISGGSGITPVMSMLRTLADAHSHPDIVFLHAGRTPADLVFRDELLWRARVTPGLRVVFLPERLSDDDAGAAHTGLVGRVSEALLQVAVPDLASRTVLCCGPAPFMAAVRRHSLALGLPEARYREESFDAAASAEPAMPAAEVASSASAPLTFQVNFARQARTLAVPAGQTVLAAARQGGVSLPSSCGDGECGTCKSRLLSGQVDMQHQGGIRPREVAAGFFLPCCSKPLSDLVIER